MFSSNKDTLRYQDPEFHVPVEARTLLTSRYISLERPSKMVSLIELLPNSKNGKHDVNYCRAIICCNHRHIRVRQRSTPVRPLFGRFAEQITNVLSRSYGRFLIPCSAVFKKNILFCLT